MRKAGMLALICGGCFAQIVPQKDGIAGTITSTGGEPVRGATVRLMAEPRPGAPRTSQPGVFSVFSDAQGKFAFHDLDAGQYSSLCAGKPGYLWACYADSDKSEKLTLARGQSLAGLDIKMQAQAVISGRLLDEDGDPLPHARVSVAHWSYLRGEKVLADSSPTAASNAEGEFTLGNLEAGTYYLHVAATSVPTNAIPKDAAIYLPTYYPGVTDPLKATSVQVKAGEAVRGVDIRVRRERAYRIRGKVNGLAAGTPAMAPSIILFSNSGANFDVSAFVRDGAFAFQGIPSGSYVLRLDAEMATADGSPAVRGVARKLVTVGNDDLNDVTLQLRPPVAVTEEFSFEGPVPRQTQNSRLSLRLTAVEPGTIGTNSTFNSDGTVTISNIMPATYWWEPQGLPPGIFVKSIHFGEKDVTNVPLDLNAGGGVLNVLLSPGAADLRGTVRKADGTPPGYTLVTLWREGAPAEGFADFTRTAHTGPKGNFQFADLPPGAYRVAAWEEDREEVATAPEFRLRFESQAGSVVLGEGARENIEPPLISREEMEAELAKTP